MFQMSDRLSPQRAFIPGVNVYVSSDSDAAPERAPKKIRRRKVIDPPLIPTLLAKERLSARAKRPSAEPRGRKRGAVEIGAVTPLDQQEALERLSRIREAVTTAIDLAGAVMNRPEMASFQAARELYRREVTAIRKAVEDLEGEVSHSMGYRDLEYVVYSGLHSSPSGERYKEACALLKSFAEAAVREATRAICGNEERWIPADETDEERIERHRLSDAKSSARKRIEQRNAQRSYREYERMQQALQLTLDRSERFLRAPPPSLASRRRIDEPVAFGGYDWESDSSGPDLVQC